MRTWRITLLLGLSLVWMSPVWAGLPFQGERVSAMTLIGPDVGWAATDDRLYWTAINGAAWKEITPTPTLRPLPEIGPVFFLDSKSGWAFIFPYGPEPGD